MSLWLPDGPLIKPVVNYPYSVDDYQDTGRQWVGPYGSTITKPSVRYRPGSCGSEEFFTYSQTITLNWANQCQVSPHSSISIKVFTRRPLVREDLFLHVPQLISVWSDAYGAGLFNFLY